MLHVHDLRNPLMTITLSAQGVLKRSRSPAIRHLARLIIGQTGHLDEFIGDLLTVTQLEQGAYPLQLTCEDLAEMGARTLSRNLIVAEGKGIRIELATLQGACWISVDRHLITRLLDNLVGNAEKFSPDGSRVVLTISPVHAGCGCRICVEDEGDGVPQGYRRTVFTVELP